MLIALAFVSMFIIGGLSRHLHGRHAGRHLHPRHLLHRRPHPLRAVHRLGCSASSAASTYWFPKMFGRMMNETLGQGPLLPDVHLRQLHVLPDAHPRRRRLPAPPGRSLPLPDVRPLAAAEPVHHHLRARLGLSQIIFVVNFLLQPVLRQEGRPQPVAGQHAGVDRPRPPGHGNFESSRSSTAGRTSTPRRRWPTTFIRKSSRPPRASPSSRGSSQRITRSRRAGGVSPLITRPHHEPRCTVIVDLRLYHSPRYQGADAPARRMS